MFWFNVWQVTSNRIGVIQVGVILFGVIWVGVDVIRIDVIQKFRMFAPNFSTSKLFSRPEFLKMIPPSRFSLLLIAAPFHNTLLLEKYDAPLMGSKRLKLPHRVTCRIMPPMVPGGFILMPSLLINPNPPLCTSVQQSRRPREISQSAFPHLAIVLVAWLEWMMVEWLVVSPNRAPEIPKGCDPPTVKS